MAHRPQGGDINRLGGGQHLADRGIWHTRLGAAIDTSLVDELYGKLLVVKEADDGKVIEHERRTTVNHAMKSCRRAWNVADRRNPGKLPMKNPFAAMGLESSDRETPTATFAELQVFRATAIAEAGDAELTDAEMRAQGRHKVLPRYAKRTMRQVAKGIQKRHAERTKSGQTSVMSNSSSSVIED